MGELQAILLALARQEGSKQAAARAIGITPQRFSRLLRGEFSLEVLNCLRLARAVNESPGVVLRAAGKQDVAELIEGAYGKTKPMLPPAHRALLDKWEALSTVERGYLMGMIDALLNGGAKARARPVTARQLGEESPPAAGRRRGRR